MTIHRLYRTIPTVCFAGTFLLASSGGGWFGLSFNIEGSGVFWNPTIERITVTKVAPNSPAESQHVLVGDSIIEIEGVLVKGIKGSVMKSKMELKVGESLHLKLQHSNGEIYSSVLVAGVRPK